MVTNPDVVSLFSPGTSVVDGELLIGGVTATQLAAEFGTPAYVIDEDISALACVPIAMVWRRAGRTVGSTSRPSHFPRLLSIE